MDTGSVPKKLPAGSFSVRPVRRPKSDWLPRVRQGRSFYLSCTRASRELWMLRLHPHVPRVMQRLSCQRLDVHNGLLLSALWDAAFDAGLVTFDDDGKVLTSPCLESAAHEALALSKTQRLTLHDEHRPYLAYHRNFVWTQG
jgi:hypothetical protein